MEDKISKPGMGSCSFTYGSLHSRINHLQYHDGSMDRIRDDFNKMAKGKHPASDEELPVWQRVKWTDPMVRLLITIVSYMGEDTASDCRPVVRRKTANLQRKGKWKIVSKVMAERGLCVSPQQCEDKLNDLSKRYKKLNDILGRGISCQVVENPGLLDVMDHLSDKAKDEVRKVLSSKQLFYEEMCSYYNGNRLHLPPDLSLQRTLQSVLGRKDEVGEDEDEGHGEKMRSPVDQLEDQKLQIEEEMMELEWKRFEWRKASRKKTRELEKTRMENERMRLENEEMALELRQMQMSINTNR